MVLKAFAVVLRQCALAGFMFLSHAALAQTPAEEPWNAKFEATYVWQSKQPFDALYSGAYSLTPAHHDYLAAGGLGFFLGDGHLNYAAEQIFESYYAIGLIRQACLTLDRQRIANPGYNADRGPVGIGSVRLHVEL